MRRKRIAKRKTIWAYLDGKKLVDVVQAALDNNMMVDDVKALLIRENPGHEVTFKVKGHINAKEQEECKPMDEIEALANRIECGTRALNIVAACIGEKLDRYEPDALYYLAETLTEAAVQLSDKVIEFEKEAAHAR